MGDSFKSREVSLRLNRKAMKRQLVRWMLAAILVLLAPCFFILGICLLAGWTAEPQPLGAGTVMLFITLGLLFLALVPGSIAAAALVAWHFRPRK
jgi:polyferredoxin